MQDWRLSQKNRCLSQDYQGRKMYRSNGMVLRMENARWRKIPYRIVTTDQDILA